MVLQKKLGKSQEYADVMDKITTLVDNSRFQVQEKGKINVWLDGYKAISQLGAWFDKSEFIAFQEFLASKAAVEIPAGKYILDCLISDAPVSAPAYQ